MGPRRRGAPSGPIEAASEGRGKGDRAPARKCISASPRLIRALLLSSFLACERRRAAGGGGGRFPRPAAAAMSTKPPSKRDLRRQRGELPPPKAEAEQALAKLEPR